MNLGSQYYRWPTPLEKDWEQDFRNMKSLGFNTVKIWAQWRTNQSREDEYDFSDLQKLMDLAQESSLAVHINIILDASPAWFFRKYPDSKMITSEGKTVEPQTVAWRQAGGAPGPCYHHPAARETKRRFVEALAQAFGAHPALEAWDIWNEPELTCGILREPKQENMTCYCPHTRASFIDWLKEKYGDIGSLNGAWHTPYADFDEVELPHTGGTFVNMIDFREFHIQTLKSEAEMRIRAVKKYDAVHPVMLHTVPMPCFNAVNACSDEYELAQSCDWFGNSVGSEPFAAALGVSAAEGKKVLNAEIHAYGGNTRDLSSDISFERLKAHVLVPLSFGVKGFLFWQYRPEILGHESPAWGISELDGSIGSRALLLQELYRALAEETELDGARPADAQIAVVNNYENQLFDYCVNGNVDGFYASVYGIFRTLYDYNYDVRFLFKGQLTAEKLRRYRVIIYPEPYLMEEKTAEMIRQWVQEGGILISEAFFGAYQREKGLHSYDYIGMGFEDVFGVKTAKAGANVKFVNAYHKDWGEDADDNSIPFRLTEENGKRVFCGFRYQHGVQCGTAEQIALFPDGSTAVSENVYGKGKAYFVGSYCGRYAAGHLQEDEAQIFSFLLRRAGFLPQQRAEGLRIDKLYGKRADYLIVQAFRNGEYTADLTDYKACFDVFAKQKRKAENPVTVSLQSGEIKLLRLEK